MNTDPIVKAQVILMTMEQMTHFLRFAEAHGLQTELLANPDNDIERRHHEPKSNGRAKPRQRTMARPATYTANAMLVVDTPSLLSKHDQKLMQRTLRKERGKEPYRRGDLSKTLAKILNKSDTKVTSQIVRRWVEKGGLREVDSPVTENVATRPKSRPKRDTQIHSDDDVFFHDTTPVGPNENTFRALRTQLGTGPVNFRTIRSQLLATREISHKNADQTVKRWIQQGHLKHQRINTKSRRSQNAPLTISNLVLTFPEADTKPNIGPDAFDKAKAMVGTASIVRKDLTALLMEQTGLSRPQSNTYIRNWMYQGLLRPLKT